jgi:hypothetical protein
MDGGTKLLAPRRPAEAERLHARSAADQIRSDQMRDQGDIQCDEIGYNCDTTCMCTRTYKYTSTFSFICS